MRLRAWRTINVGFRFKLMLFISECLLVSEKGSLFVKDRGSVAVRSSGNGNSGRWPKRTSITEPSDYSIVETVQ